MKPFWNKISFARFIQFGLFTRDTGGILELYADETMPAPIVLEIKSGLVHFVRDRTGGQVEIRNEMVRRFTPAEAEELADKLSEAARMARRAKQCRPILTRDGDLRLPPTLLQQADDKPKDDYDDDDEPDSKPPRPRIVSSR